jgi:DNA-binding IclR family transcriptional regulator
VAAGKVLLAELAPIDVILRHPTGPREPPADRIHHELLGAELSAIRRLGYATGTDDVEHGVSTVSVAIKDAGGRAIGSLTVACPTVRCPRSRLEPLVTELRSAAAGAADGLLADPDTRRPGITAP